MHLFRLISDILNGDKWFSFTSHIKKKGFLSGTKFCKISVFDIHLLSLQPFNI